MTLELIAYHVSVLQHPIQRMNCMDYERKFFIFRTTKFYLKILCLHILSHISQGSAVFEFPAKANDYFVFNAYLKK